MMLQTFWLPSPRGNRLLPSATRPQALAGTSFDRAAPGPDGASRQVLRQGTFPARFRVLCPINGPAAEEFHFAHIPQFGTRTVSEPTSVKPPTYRSHCAQTSFMAVPAN